MIHGTSPYTLIKKASKMTELCLLYVLLQEQESENLSRHRVTQSSSRALVTSRFEPLIETQFGALARPDQNRNQHILSHLPHPNSFVLTIDC